MRRKKQLESGINSLKQKAQEKRNEVDKIDQNSIEVQLQVADVKKPSADECRQNDRDHRKRKNKIFSTQLIIKRKSHSSFSH